MHPDFERLIANAKQQADRLPERKPVSRSDHWGAVALSLSVGIPAIIFAIAYLANDVKTPDVQAGFGEAMSSMMMPNRNPDQRFTPR